MPRNPRRFPAPQDERIVGQIFCLFSNKRTLFTLNCGQLPPRSLIFILEFSRVTEI